MLMSKSEYTPSELLEVLRKVNPEAYRHIVWLIRAFLKIGTADWPSQNKELPTHKPRQ